MQFFETLRYEIFDLNIFCVGLSCLSDCFVGLSSYPGSIPSDRKSIPDKIRGSNRAKIRRLKQTMMMLIRSIRLAVELQH